MRFAWIWVQHGVSADFASGMGPIENLSSRNVGNPLRRDCIGFPIKVSESENVSGGILEGLPLGTARKGRLGGEEAQAPCRYPNLRP